MTFDQQLLVVVPAEKACSACKASLPINCFRIRKKGSRRVANSSCKQCEKAARLRPERVAKERASSRAWRRANRDKVAATGRRSKLKRYGLTEQTLRALTEAQCGRCAACGRAPGGRGANSRLHIDHDHVTGRYRGLICNPCNVALGMLYDDPSRIDSLAAYARRFSR